MQGEKLPPGTRKLLWQMGAGFGAVLLVLTVAHICLSMTAYQSDNWLARQVDLDEEANFASWYASMLWFSVSLSALAAFWGETKGQLKRGLKFVWVLIATIFAVASLDEIATL